MIQLEELKSRADRLERAINMHRNQCEDIEFLATNPTLSKALCDAREGRVPEVKDLGLSRWVFDSSIQNYSDIAEALAQFSVLIRGLEDA